MKPFNQLTPAQAERLALLAEECGEVIQVVGKILRHGMDSTHPRNRAVDNRQLLEEELGDLMCVVHDFLVQSGDVRYEHIVKYRQAKHSRVRQYLHHN